MTLIEYYQQELNSVEDQLKTASDEETIPLKDKQQQLIAKITELLLQQELRKNAGPEEVQARGEVISL